MKNIPLHFVVTLFLSCSFILPKFHTLAAVAQEAGEAELSKGPGAELDLALYNQFVWRGLALSNSNSSLVIQPAMTVN